ncbi:MAG: hypothetical protein WAT39_00090 [Planctomycetota bacterium]
MLADTAGMGKLLLAACAVLSVALGGNRMASFSIDPDPPKRGKNATITYAANTRISVEFDPGGVQWLVTDANGQVVVSIPSNCATVTANDPNTPGSAQAWTCSP